MDKKTNLSNQIPIPENTVTCSNPSAGSVCPNRFYVYILASKTNGALFVGLTDELLVTVLRHKCNEITGLTSQYAIHRLVYYEHHDEKSIAVMRMRKLKQMNRSWKLNLVSQHNSDWRDLYEDLGNLK